jgi:adenylosuccinate lyase
LCGLARILRGNSQAALENVALWHERDISHSSVERIILPDSTILVDYMLHQLTRVVRDLQVYPRHMAANIGLSRGLSFSGAVLLALVDKGMTREQAYDLVQGAAMEVWQEGGNFREALEQIAGKVLSTVELDEIFNYKDLLAQVDIILARAGIGDGENA